MIYWQNIALAVGSTIAICFVMLVLMMWLSSLFMVLSLGFVSLYLIVLVALVWEQYDQHRSRVFLVFGVLLSLFMLVWFFFFVRIGKKIELIFHLFHLAATIMKSNLRMLIYAAVVIIK